MLIELLIATAFAQQTVTGDFNGDGRQDKAALIKLEPALPAGATRANPWSRNNSWTAVPGGLAISVILAGVPGSTLISDREFFTTPMWSNPKDLVSVKPRGSGPKEARGDLLAVATESGADVYLYLANGRWRLWYPKDEQ